VPNAPWLRTALYATSHLALQVRGFDSSAEATFSLADKKVEVVDGARALWQVGTHCDITFSRKAICTCIQLMRPVELENVAYIKRIKNFSCLDLCGLILFGEANIRDLIILYACAVRFDVTRNHEFFFN
jgi:hypothetical protein